MFQVRDERGEVNKLRSCGQRAAHRTEGRIRNTHRKNLGDYSDLGNGDGKDGGKMEEKLGFIHLVRGIEFGYQET